MLQIYCVNHQKFEVVTYDRNHVISFNEQDPIDHHFADEYRDYIHSGKKASCEICQKS